jgi:hypothetical protein
MSISEISTDVDYLFEDHSTQIFQETSELPQPEDIESHVGRFVLLNSDEKRAHYKVDNCLRIDTPSDLFRSQALHHWRETRSSAALRAWVSIGVVSLSLACFAMTSYTVASIAVGVFALTNALVLFHQASEAQKQIAFWQVSQVESIAAQRRTAYKEGFGLVYHSPSLSKLLLPFEIAFLFDRYFERFFNALLIRQCNTEKEKTQWLEEFVKGNPISSALLHHVYGHHVPRSYNQLSVQFEAVSSSLQQVRKDFEKIRQEKRTEHDQLLKHIEVEKNKLLKPLDDLLQTQLREARKVRDEEQSKARLHRLSSPANNNLQLETEAFHEDQAIKNYEDKIFTARKTHESLTQPIHRHFEEKKEEAKQSLKAAEKNIDKQETDALSRYYMYAHSLAEAALNAKNPEFDEVPLFTPVTPSAPPPLDIQIEYKKVPTNP